MKICNRCTTNLPVTAFGNNKTMADGLQTICKTCAKDIAKKYSRTEQGLATKIYSNQKNSSRRRGYTMPSYTRDELYEWLVLQPNFKKLYLDWINSNYKKSLTPSCDREDDTKPYSLDSIKLVTWQENNSKALLDRASGKLRSNMPHKPVDQYTTAGEYITSYGSITLASEAVNTGRKNISKVLAGVNKTAAGFLWKYATHTSCA